MLLSFLKSPKLKLGLIGAMTGAVVPVFYSILQSSISHYTGASLLNTVVTVGALGAAGSVVGGLIESASKARAEIDARDHELALLNSVSETARNTRDLDSLLYFVLKETMSLPVLARESKGVMFVKDDSEAGVLRLAAQMSLEPHLTQTEKTIPYGHCLCGKAAATGNVIVSKDCLEDEEHTVRFDGMERHGHVVVPVKGPTEVLGVMCYYLRPGVSPSKEDLRILKAVAGQLAPAIENIILARKASSTREDLNINTVALARKVNALNSLVEVDRIILSTLDRDEMLFRVSVQIRQLIPADVGGVALMDPDTGDYRYIGGWGMEIKSRDILQTADWLGNPVLNYGKPLLRRNIEEEVILSPFDKMLHETGVRSDIYAPIMRKGKTVGIFFLGCFRESAFSQEDVDTAVTFASRMGIALEHVRLIYDLDEMSVNIIHALASAIDAKSSWTKGHSERVSDYALAIAEKMGISKRDIERLRLAGLLHDIGKIGTYDTLLEKTGKLTEEEWELIKLHPVRGCEILEPITEFKDILPAVRHHHERWDGKGYPKGLRGEDIPLMARILCVADAFDTMTADRPYRPAIGLQNAIQELEYCSGTQFAPEVAEAFLGLIHERGAEITAPRKSPLRKPKSPIVWS
jgi:putative nucleotidyltransferase with HDIG domain